MWTVNCFVEAGSAVYTITNCELSLSLPSEASPTREVAALAGSKRKPPPAVAKENTYVWTRPGL